MTHLLHNGSVLLIALAISASAWIAVTRIAYRVRSWVARRRLPDSAPLESTATGATSYWLRENEIDWSFPA